jgi:hypothetical protein
MYRLFKALLGLCLLSCSIAAGQTSHVPEAYLFPPPHPYPNTEEALAQPASAEPITPSLEQRLAELEAKLVAQGDAECATCDACDPSKPLMFGWWNHGLELRTEDESFRVHVGGRTQFDAGWFAVDEDVQQNINHPYENGVDFRRARLRVDGRMHEWTDWAVEV